MARALLIILVALSLSTPFALLAKPPRLDLPAALAACQAHCAPNRGAWRFGGRALACACDDLDVGVCTPRRK